jgi:hypothetical protein
VSRPRLRVVCSAHDEEVLARVVETDQGPTYEFRRPLLAGRLFVARGGITRGLDHKNGSRLPEAGNVLRRVALSSPDAARYTFSAQYHGSLPAWCGRCGATYWPTVEQLRTLKGTLRV